MAVRALRDITANRCSRHGAIPFRDGGSRQTDRPLPPVREGAALVPQGGGNQAVSMVTRPVVRS